ncbi:hypothetical protein F652_1068 [Enterobacteriaceae bacterium bta3-1]|nr:hypothetical protein F652_1068 [Enterobacteriaceae bacterium bta3-1]
MPQIAIVEQCHFIRNGLKNLLLDITQEQGNHTEIHTFNSISDIDKCRYKSVESGLDSLILVVNASSGFYSLTKGFHPFIENLVARIPSIKIIIICEDTLQRLAYHELRSHHSVSGIISTKSKIDDLKAQLENVIYSHNQPTRPNNPSRIMLTQREQQVINALLSGKSAAAIAGKLNVSQKTISAHKINALKKLNIRTIAMLFDILPLSSQEINMNPYPKS